MEHPGIAGRDDRGWDGAILIRELPVEHHRANGVEGFTVKDGLAALFECIWVA